MKYPGFWMKSIDFENHYHFLAVIVGGWTPKVNYGEPEAPAEGKPEHRFWNSSGLMGVRLRLKVFWIAEADSLGAEDLIPK